MIAAAELPPDQSSLAPWLLLGSAAVGGALYWRSRNRDASETPTPLVEAATTAVSVPPSALVGRWVWPMLRWEGRAPVISDGYGSPRPRGNRGQIHRGVDLMYRRRSRSDLADRFPPRPPHSRWHFTPPGTVVVAAGPGEVWSAGWTSRGYSVVISHGAPWATYYTHLSSLFIRDSRRGSSGERVVAGQPIGIVGADPQDGNAIAHLHFEVWRGGAGDHAIDPAPLLARWPVLTVASS